MDEGSLEKQIYKKVLEDTLNEMIKTANENKDEDDE